MISKCYAKRGLKKKLKYIIIIYVCYSSMGNCILYELICFEKQCIVIRQLLQAVPIRAIAERSRVLLRFISKRAPLKTLFGRKTVFRGVHNIKIDISPCIK